MKKVSPAALISLKEALSKIYWVKNDLRAFIEYTIDNKTIIATIDWSSLSKYESVSQLVDRMVKRKDLYQEDLLKLFYAVCNVSNFNHLKKWEDADKKIREAKEAVDALKAMCIDFFDELDKDRKKGVAKEQYNYQLSQSKDYQNRLDHLKQKYFLLSKEDNAQKRGYLFETFLNELFKFFDLEPRGSFKISGEQIDGAFTHDSNDYLLEAKWVNKLIEASDVDIFSAKIGRKLKTALGLLVSVNGFSESLNLGIIKYNAVILMDSVDLIQVLENRIKLDDMIKQKRRHASETGLNMYRINC